MAPLASSRTPLALAELAQVVRRGTRSLPSETAATGMPEVDALIGGGLPRQRLTELVGRRSGGRTSFVLGALAAATARGEVAALVDLAGGLDARSAEEAGVDLERLLWVRGAKDMKRGIQATKNGNPYLIDVAIARTGGGAESTWHEGFKLTSKMKG